MSEDQEEKTEDPTQRRLDDAKKKGQVAFSREVSNFFMIVTLTLIVGMALPWILTSGSESLAKYIASPHDIPIGERSFNEIAWMIVKDAAKMLAAPFLFLLAAAIGASLIQNGFNISYEPITPKLEKISVMKGWKRLFSLRSFMEFIKGIIKITIVGVVAYYSVKNNLTDLKGLPAIEAGDMMNFTAKLVMAILINCSIALFFIAVIDFLYQKFEHIKQLRMTKQEIKEEYKQQEGDPHIKGKLKQIRMEKARKRMMAAVPTADVVITNPIHYAVALKYNQDNGGAPTVVAKGTDRVAERIKELANENKVPIVRNPVLARSLHADCDLDEEIPYKHYQAVAEVISYVFKLKGKKN